MRPNLAGPLSWGSSSIHPKRNRQIVTMHLAKYQNRGHYKHCSPTLGLRLGELKEQATGVEHDSLQLLNRREVTFGNPNLVQLPKAKW